MAKQLKLRLLLLGLVLAAAASASFAQQDDEDVQSWNDLQITVPINTKVDALILATLRVGSNVTKVSEMRVGGGIQFHPTKWLNLSPVYHFIDARNTAGHFHDEHRLSMRATVKFPTKGFGLSHRSIYEYRLRTSGNSWRYRPSLTLEKALPERILPRSRLFITEEPFYVSTTKRFSRNRFSVGISHTFTKKLTLDVYYLRQNDGRTHPGDLNVVGTSWKVHL